ncbi:hypothetical protein LINPERPRIM_LOCUS32982 [Linum perenne]
MLVNLLFYPPPPTKSLIPAKRVRGRFRGWPNLASEWGLDHPTDNNDNIVEIKETTHQLWASAKYARYLN